ncbi:PocR ligand-binding domain-containing protein [Anaerosinus sp.]|uniref:PocR ligand-binding domain-containing protein n=1 Tax=Selenobaculum sp. TaxID=3074374 RepID=UPI0015A8B48D
MTNNIEKDLENLKVEDVFDMKFLQEFQDSFAKSLGMTAVTVDLKGNPITRPSYWTKFCMEYTRNSPIGNKRCMECDRIGGETSAKNGKPAIYECHAGLMDFAAPIMLNGKQIGSILGGQVLTEPLVESKYRKIAEEIGVNPDEYVAAVREINYMPRENLEAAANVLFLMANAFSQMGYYKFCLKDMSEIINEKLMHVSATMEELAASANDVNENQNNLNNEIKNVNLISVKINEVTDLIKDIANETQLLGLNASIEAARAGVAGAGFGVVAQEIRKLSGNSKETVEKIREFTGMINSSVNETVDKGAATLEIVSQQTSAIESVANELIKLSETAAELYNLAHEK